MCGGLKFGKDYLRSKEYHPPHKDPQTRVSVPGRYVPITSGYKNQRGLSWWKQLLEPQAIPLKEPTQELNYSHSLPLSSSTGVAASKAPVE